MRLRPHEAAMACLDAEEMPEGVVEASPFSRETAVEFLQLLTGKTLGDDSMAWRKWFEERGTDEYVEACYENVEKAVQSKDHPRFHQRVAHANARWQSVTNRRCPECQALCPEYRKHCMACGFSVGRV
jgi:hypothetical protein